MLLCGAAHRLDAFRAAYGELWRWTDREKSLKDAKYTALHVHVDSLDGRFGVALKTVNGVIADTPAPSQELLNTRVELLQALGWQKVSDGSGCTLHVCLLMCCCRGVLVQWASIDKILAVVRNPKDFTLF